MFKLLTEESRAKVAGEYKLRRYVVIGASLCAALAMTLTGLFPSYILSKVKQDEAKALSQAFLAGEREDLGAWLADFNRKLRVLSAGAAQSQASLAMERALAQKSVGIRINQLKWGEAEGGELTLIGVATDRQALLAFEKRLKDSGNFSEVILPVSNLAKERDINFQMNLTLTP